MLKSVVAGVALTLTMLSTRAENVKLESVNVGCETQCSGRHAIVFVHGIYGSRETFTNTRVQPAFSWPENVPRLIAGAPVDTFRLDYKTVLISWAKADIVNFDELVESIYPQLISLSSPKGKNYDSVNFVAHSLGGNVVTAYLHSVKSEDGHMARSKHGFVITVGTPINGAAIANVGLLLKDLLGMRDPLLRSLEKDNTFLRMMRFWAKQEDAKARKFNCRTVDLYAGIETRPMGPIQVVDTASAADVLPFFARRQEFSVNHSEIAKPSSTSDPIFRWFSEIAEFQINRLHSWKSPLCETNT